MKVWWEILFKFSRKVEHICWLLRNISFDSVMSKLKFSLRRQDCSTGRGSAMMWEWWGGELALSVPCSGWRVRTRSGDEVAGKMERRREERIPREAEMNEEKKHQFYRKPIHSQASLILYNQTWAVCIRHEKAITWNQKLGIEGLKQSKSTHSSVFPACF